MKPERSSKPVNGKELRRLLDEQGIEIPTLAKYVDVTSRTVQNWLSGSNAAVVHLKNAAAVLNVEWRELTLNARGKTAVSPSPVVGAAWSGEPVDWTQLQPRQLHTFDQADARRDGEDAVRQALHPLWHPESEGGWASTVMGSAYWMHNQRGIATDRRWIEMSPESGELSHVPVSVEALLRGAETTFQSAAGLLYRYQEGRTRYYAFMLTGDGQVRFSVNTKDGERTLYKNGALPLPQDRFAMLGIASARELFHLYVNNVHVQTIRHDLLKTGGVGIVASGPGGFGFRNLTIY